MRSETDDLAREKRDEPALSTPTHDVRALLGSDQRAFLRLDEEVYTLRITRNGKLILTK